MKRLETHHLIAIHYLAQPRHGGKTMEEIAKECGVTRQTLYNWMRDPLFDRELKREMARQSLNRLPEVLESMADAAVEDRNAAAAKLVLQVHGMLTDKLEVEQKQTEKVPDIEELKREIAGLDEE